MKTVWEYKTHSHNRLSAGNEGTLVEVLNEFGLDGWQLVSALWSGSNFNVVLILKREKKASKP